ncbi:hypothetical protein JCM3775_003655 [Rhodotorula graminis]|uniref:Enoyl reductase (ER) domain-containing protein n=1 Tax=Rhodotorula graminis (strain WP1) TaxID=578459 RepID=A0A194S502_RHOGW|nr:uncharacterized protein RHOBADRAFT_36458 [Rhodotorula graminis WP1]KPV75590.1 hypothetical protein RHOBADRAFT_36458 [Rhodotorula graminis WP1]
MRAWVYRTKGKPADVLRLEDDYPKPEPAQGQLLVSLRAVSTNPVFFKTMGMAPMRYMQRVPCVPEGDFSGVVAGGSLDGTDLKLGDEVFGIVPAQITMKNGKGALAEYLVCDKDLVVKKPANVSFEEASTFPLTTFTAYWALVRTGKLEKGKAQRVFINGGSGGVGAYAVQLAKAYGAFVATTCSPPSRELVSSLGADDVHDYKESDLATQLSSKYSGEPFDIFFDTVGHDTSLYYKSPTYLKPSGIYVDVAGPHIDGSIGSLLRASVDFANRLLRPKMLGGVPRKYTFGMMTTDRKELEEMAALIGEGKLRPIVDSVFAFEDALKAYERQMSNRAKGKVVVKVSQ